MEGLGVRSVDDWLVSILRDFSSTVVAATDVRLISLAEVAEGAAVDLPDAGAWVDSDDPDSSGLLLIVGGNVSAIAGSRESAEMVAVEIASYLQDIVMDDLNHPWPQIEQVGGLVVLEPRLDDSGMPVWAGGELIRAFGELNSHPLE